MNPLQIFRDREQAELDAPPTPGCKWFKLLFVLYLFSFVFDFNTADLVYGDRETGSSSLQLALLAVAFLSGGVGSIFGYKRLLSKPGVYLVMLWWGYVFLSVVVSFLSGNETGWMLRWLIPYLLIGLGMNLTLICACVGMRPREAIRWLIFAGVVNMIGRLLYGVFVTGVPVSEVQIPAIPFLFAWSTCALVLRQRMSPSMWVVSIAGFGIAILSIYGSAAFSIIISFVAAAFCLLLGLTWKMLNPKYAERKAPSLAAFGSVALSLLFVAVVVWPGARTHGHNQGAGPEAMSSLVRKREAKAIWDTLSKDPASFIYGKGLGASYYWHEDYHPENLTGDTIDQRQSRPNIHRTGSNFWSYTLFSGGVIGTIAMLGVFCLTMALSLRSGYLNSQTVMGPRARDSFLIFLPFVSVWALLGESITRQLLDEKLTGVLFGIVMVFPQFYLNRAFFLMYREKVGQNATQLILEKEDFQAYPGQRTSGNELRDAGGLPANYPGTKSRTQVSN